MNNMEDNGINLKVLWHGKSRNGSPIRDLIKMVHYSNPKVKFIQYTGTESGDVIFGTNRIDRFPKNIRKVMYMGSLPSFIKGQNRVKEGVRYNKVNHMFFISEYFRKIILSKWNIKNNSIFLPFGSMPCDPNMEPVIETRKIEGPLQFVAIAKWYKRKYKRLNKVIEFFNDFILKKYPYAHLNIIGTKETKKENNITYYKKSFHDMNIVDVFKKSHIQLILTPFDTGPKTLTESLHYRVPFICSNNCSGNEYIDLVGRCGVMVNTDPLITTMKDYTKYKPLKSPKWYNKQIDYSIIMKAVEDIVDNYEIYTSWKWNEKLNYRSQSEKLYDILSGK